jgi:tryptophan halogenase
MNNTNNTIKSILVVGGGTAGWMSACYMVRQGFNVTLVESPKIPTIGVGESCLPALGIFCDALGLKEEEWMPEANARHKIGIFHHNWLRKEDTVWKHWFCYDRNDCDGQYYLESGILPPVKQGKYAFHIDAVAFGQMLKRRVADPAGVKYVQAHIHDIQQYENGYVSGLLLDNGTTLSADFYIDCSGPARLFSKKVGIEFSRYGDILNDRAVVCPQPLEPGEQPKYTITYAGTAGWIWDTGLAHRRGCGYTYSSQFITDEQAKAEYLTYFPKTDQSKMRVIDYDSTYSHNPLEKNVLAVGLASGFMEPLEATSIYLVQYYLETFAKFVNSGRNPRVFNKAALILTKQLYDFVLTNYTLTQRDDTEHWRYFKDLETRLKTKDLVLEWASHEDVGEWAVTRMFSPFNWWSKAEHFELYKPE